MKCLSQFPEQGQLHNILLIFFLFYFLPSFLSFLPPSLLSSPSLFLFLTFFHSCIHDAVCTEDSKIDKDNSCFQEAHGLVGKMNTQNIYKFLPNYNFPLCEIWFLKFASEYFFFSNTVDWDLGLNLVSPLSLCHST